MNKQPAYTRLPFQRFFNQLVQGSYPLLFAAFAALVWANMSPETYYSFWHAELSIILGPFKIAKSTAHWVDEALMALFFFTVGLEIKREFIVGHLSSMKQAMLPITAAIGGMVVPAIFYYAFNCGSPSLNGWAIPMATDIAFSLAVLSVLGKRIPFGLKIFLTAFAIVDDLGAVVIIAIFYTKQIIWWPYFGIALFFLIGLAIANLMWIRKTIVYILLGIGLWFGILGSGIHATVAGVIVAMFILAKGKYDTDTFIQNVYEHLNSFACDAQRGCGHSILLNRKHMDAVQSIDLACQDVETPLQRFEHGLQSWVSLFVMPLFALANAGLVFKHLDVAEAILHPVTLGIITGLTIGKPLGIITFTLLSIKLFKTKLIKGLNLQHIIGAGFLGGIGFTMSLFISGLSFTNEQFINYSKLGIIIGSAISCVIGFLILYPSARLFTWQRNQTKQ
jgi:NhaA family Na+:H+ antiporter